ncbi:MAG: fibronectin type III domain-containing protein [bacterium]
MLLNKIKNNLKNLNYQLFTKKVYFIKWQLNIFALIWISIGIVAGAYITLSGVGKIFAVDAPWTQTDWSGGVVGGTVNTTVNTYSSSSNVDTTGTPGQITLNKVEKLSNTGFESDLASWNTTIQPSSITGLKLWLKADAIVGLNNNDPVTTWTDSSGNANATQSTASYKPLYITNSINSLPAVRFDGSDDYLSTTATTAGLAPEVFLVIRNRTHSSLGIGFSSPQNGYHIGTYGLASGNIGGIKSNGVNYTSQAFALNNFGIIRNYFGVDQGTNASKYGVNGNETSYTLVGGDFTATNLANIDLGRFNAGGHYQNEDIAEVIVYNTGLSSDNRGRIENYLRDKYNIAITTGITSATRDTVTKYGGSTGSAKLVSTGTRKGEFTQSINLGDTNTYNISTYAYTNGSAVTSSDIELFSNGSTITTTYNSVGSGWYQLTGTVVGANAVRTYGVQFKGNKTVYIDNISLNTYVTTGSVTSNIFDSTVGQDWTTLGYNSSGSVSVKVRSSNSSTMSGATAFSSCTAIASGANISTGGCVTNNQRYVQYEVTLNTADNTTPVFSDITINKTESDVTPPPTNASSILMYTSNGGTGISSNAWTNSSTPYFTWTAGIDNVGGKGIKGYCLNLNITTAGDPATVKGILGTSPVSTVGSTCQFIVAGTSLDLSTSGYLASALTSSTSPYYLSIKAIDVGNNIYQGASTSFQFRFDNTPPTNVTYISSTNGSFFNISDMFFTWPTTGGTASIDNESQVIGWQYKINGTSGSWNGSFNDPTLGVKYIPVGEAQPYYLDPVRDGSDIIVGNNVIYFRTIDSIGNTSIQGTYRTANISYGGEAPTFSKSCLDETGITLTPSALNSNLFALSWDAAVPALGKTIKSYYYMVNTNPPNSYSSILSNSATYIPVLTNSVPIQKLIGAVKGDNTVYVVSVDNVNNYSGSSCLKGKFVLNSSLPDPALNLLVSDASIKEALLWRGSLVWENPAYQGTGTLTYKIQRSENGTTWTDVDTTTGNSYIDTVAESKPYYWRVGTTDNSDESKASPSYTNAVTLTPKGKFKNPAKLNSGPNVISGIRTGEISWTTDRSSDSKVSYGLASGEYFKDEVGNSAQNTDHIVNLTNLKPSTSYFFKVSWTDEDGNTGQSDEKIFTTDSAPIVKNTVTRYVSISSAQIDFTSIKASKVKLYYGISTSFGGAKELATSVSETNYSLTLDGLQDGTKYYYKINTIDTEGNEYDNLILDFTTLPRPTVTNIKLQQVKNTAETTLIVSWITNTEESSIVTYYPEGLPTSSRDLVNLTLVKGDHKMTMNQLNPDTPYILIVKGRDKVGNEAVSESIKFTTSTDTRPPAISELTIDTNPVTNENTNNQKSQVVLNWNTDEPATTSVEYGDGYSDTYNTKTTTDFNLTLNHQVVISGLEPSKVYHFRAISNDKANNTGYSSNTVAITASVSKDVTTLILNTLKNLFNF